MKKIIICVLHIILFNLAWSDSEEVYKSIDCVLNEPYRYWHLALDENNNVRKANTFERIFYRVSSLFSNFHKERLQKALEVTIDEAENYSINLLNDKQLISLDKICFLVSHVDQNFWFHQIESSTLDCNRRIWNYDMKDLKEDQKLLRPYRHNSLFYNDESEKATRLSFTEIAVFIKSIFKSSSNIDLSTLVQHDNVLPRSDKLNIQWLGHSSFLIQIDNLNILADPVTEAFHPLFGGAVRCFKRYIQPGVELADLPKIDVIVISHNHLDHLEDKALLYLKRYQPQLLVPYGLKKYFDDKGFKNVKEHMWWEETIALSNDGKKVSLHAVPARHNSMSRGGVEKQESLWCGWVVEANDKHIYFAGDTAFNELMFSQIKGRFGSIDVAMIPIAPDKMWDRHIDYLDALRVLDILDGKVMIPMHWGAYRTGDEKVEEPYLRMVKEKTENQKYNGRIEILKIGQRYQEK